MSEQTGTQRGGTQAGIGGKLMHIYLVGTDYVVAESAEDAREVVRGLIGDDVDDDDNEPELWPDDKPMTVVSVDEPGNPRETMLPAEWAAKYGRGPIASTEA